MTLGEFITAQENVVLMLRKRDEMNAAVHDTDDTRLSPVTLNALSVLGYLRRQDNSEEPQGEIVFDVAGDQPHKYVPLDIGIPSNWMCAVLLCESDEWGDDQIRREHPVHQR